MYIPLTPLVRVLTPVTEPIGHWLLQYLTRIEKLDTESVKDYQDKEGIVTEEFVDVFTREAIVYAGVIVLFVVPVIWFVHTGVIPIGVLGLWLSAIGSLSVARSAVRGKAGIVVGVRENASRTLNAASKSIPDQGAVRANCRHTVHGVFGAVILSVGFIVQIVGSILGNLSI